MLFSLIDQYLSQRKDRLMQQYRQFGHIQESVNGGFNALS
ncbi:hypothetical protein B4143_2451 [Bacillus subtilis]|nr:hypothetical protein B4143_2451 [Bacillus subtilis]